MDQFVPFMYLFELNLWMNEYSPPESEPDRRPRRLESQSGRAFLKKIQPPRREVRSTAAIPVLTVGLRASGMRALTVSMYTE